MIEMKKKMLLSLAALAAMTSTAFADATIPADAYYWEGHFYYVFDNVADTWEEAEAYCESRGGYLAVIDREAENKELYDLMKRSGYSSAYFGLTDARHKNVWKWVDESPLDYTHWGAGEPNHYQGEHYGMFYANTPAYEWNDGDFGRGVTPGSGKAFICEWDSLEGSGVVYTPDGVRGGRPDHRRHPGMPAHRGTAPAAPAAQQTPAAPSGQPAAPSEQPAAQPMQLGGGTLVTYLRFNDTASKDEAGASWTSYGGSQDTFGAKSGKALKLENKGYLGLNKPVTFGGQDFTIDFWLNMSSYSGSYARAFVFYDTDSSNSKAILFYRSGTSGNFYTMWDNTSVVNSSMKLDQLTHVALVYRHDLGKLITYINGKKDSEISRTIPRTTFKKGWLGKSNYPSDGFMTGAMDEFRVIDGTALWKSDFVPPTAY